MMVVIVLFKLNPHPLHCKGVFSGIIVEVRKDYKIFISLIKKIIMEEENVVAEEAVEEEAVEEATEVAEEESAEEGEEE